MSALRSTEGDGGYLDGLQYLRGIAAMMVVFHHARHFVGSGLGIDFGARGVEIFFAISGLVMMQATRGSALAHGLPARRRGRVVADFLSRRVVRVVPLYWVAILVFVTVVGHWGIVPPGTLLRDAFFVPHWSELDARHVWPTLVPGWSLNLEMLFYLIFGISLAIGRAGAWISCAVIVGLCALHGVADPRSAVQILYTNPVMLCFAAGILLYGPIRALSERRLPAWTAPATVVLGFALLAGALPIPRLVRDPLAVTMIVGGAAIWSRGPAVALAAKALHRLGDASYAIYLFHGVFLIATSHALTWSGIGASSNALALAQFAAYLFVAALAGMAAHVFVERPLLAGARRMMGLARTRPPIGVALPS